jgi:protein-tyrosine phosphatase
MFQFFRKKKAVSQTERQSKGFGFLGIDIHNHLVPGIDDGAPDASQSLLLMDGLCNLGFDKFICTPHTYQEIYPNTSESITAAHAVLREAIASHSVQPPTKASSEYLADADLINRLRAKQVLPLPDNYLLVEFPFVMEPMDAEDLIFGICVNGYKPILAHPERYSYYYANPAKLERFKEMGASLQMNLLSSSGYYGKEVMEFTHQLLKKRLYDFAGTDLHHERHLRNLVRLSENDKLMRLLENYGFKNKGIFYPHV